jgi:preprotein translocase subunit Sec63
MMSSMCMWAPAFAVSSRANRWQSSSSSTLNGLLDISTVVTFVGAKLYAACLLKMQDLLCAVPMTKKCIECELFQKFTFLSP